MLLLTVPHIKILLIAFSLVSLKRAIKIAVDVELFLKLFSHAIQVL